MPTSMLTKPDFSLQPDNSSENPDLIFRHALVLNFPGFPSLSAEIFLEVDDSQESFLEESRPNESNEEDQKEVRGFKTVPQKTFKFDSTKCNAGITNKIDQSGSEVENKITLHKQVETIVQTLLELEDDSKRLPRFTSKPKRGWSFERGDARQTNRTNKFTDKIRSSSEQKRENSSTRHQWSINLYTFLKSSPAYLAHKSRDKLSAEKTPKG
jgi:hypothetical protein